ncbi:hypothetical protein Tco_0862014 [Tanacetum coccineum]
MDPAIAEHGMDKCDNNGTPMATQPKLDADLRGTPVDQTKYHSMIGSLMHLTSSRPNLVHAACYCACHVGCLDTCKSTSGKIQFFDDKLVGWSSKKQDCTAMSTAKAEYVALSASCAQILWMKTLLTDYGFHFNRIPMYCNSKSAITISCNPVHFKHINVCYHFIKEHVENGRVELYFVRTEYQLADLFTKSLSKEKFEYLVGCLGMRCLTPAELEVLANESARYIKDRLRSTRLLLASHSENVDIEKGGNLLQPSIKSTSNSSAVVDMNNSPIFIRYPNLQGNSDIGTVVVYRKASLASPDVPALDKPHF